MFFSAVFETLATVPSTALRDFQRYCRIWKASGLLLSADTYLMDWEMSLIMPSYCFVVLQRTDYSCCLHSCCKYCCIQLWPNISPLDVSRPSSPPAAVTSSKAAAVLTFGAKLPVCATQKPAFSFLPCQKGADASYVFSPTILSAADSRKHPFIRPQAQLAPNLKIRLSKAPSRLMVHPQTPL